MYAPTLKSAATVALALAAALTLGACNKKTDDTVKLPGSSSSSSMTSPSTTNSGSTGSTGTSGTGSMGSSTGAMPPASAASGGRY